MAAAESLWIHVACACLAAGPGNARHGAGLQACRCTLTLVDTKMLVLLDRHDDAMLVGTKANARLRHNSSRLGPHKGGRFVRFGLRAAAQRTRHGHMARALLLQVVVALATALGTAAAERIITVRCESTAGPWEVEVHPSWSPNGATRYLDLVKDKFYDGVPLFRAVPGFLVQFGINLDKKMNEKWGETIADDPFPVHVEMKKGILAYAGYGKHSRSTQIWIGFEGASGLGHSPWETPFAEVVSGMDSVEKIYGGYGDKVDQGKIHNQGAAYLDKEFPKLDYIKRCFIKSDSKDTQ